MSEKKVGKRLLTWVLVLVMTLSLLPLNVLAAETASSGNVKYGTIDKDGKWTATENGTGTNNITGITGVKSVSKTAKPITDEYGKIIPNQYDVTLKVELEQTTSTTLPGAAATVLVMDHSGSMNGCAFCNSWQFPLGKKYYHAEDCKYDKQGRNTEVEYSQSRMAAATEAVKSFIKTYSGRFDENDKETTTENLNLGRWVCLVWFNKTGGVVNGGWLDVSNKDAYNAAIVTDGWKAQEGTNLDCGLKFADNQLKQDTVKKIEKSLKNVVVLTDGKPTYYLKEVKGKSDIIIGDTNYKVKHDGKSCDEDTFQNTKNSATDLMNSASVYTVCFGASGEKIKDYDEVKHPEIAVGDYLKNKIATSPTSGKIYAYDAGDTNGLMSAFAAITKDIVSGLNSGTVTDSLPTCVTADNRFVGEWKLNADEAVKDTKTEDGVKKTIYTWEKTYTVTINPETAVADKDGYVPLNGKTTLTVDGGSVDFPIPAGKVTPKTLTLTATDYTGKYDGKAHGGTVTSPNGATLTYQTKDTEDGTYADYNGVPQLKDVGKLWVKVTAEKKGYKTESAEYTIEVTKCDVILTSATDSKEYDGTQLTNDEVTVGGDGFVTGEGATYNVTGTATNVSTEPAKNTFEYTLNTGTNAANYNINKVEGTLTITPKQVTIKVNDAGKFFGDDDPAFTGTVPPDLINADDLGEITYVRTNKDVEAVGTYPDVLDAQYINNTNYDVIVEKGDFEIKTATSGALLTAQGGEWTYDGESHTATASVSGADGYTIYYKVGGADWTTDAPSVTDVNNGLVTVSVKATKAGYADLTCTDVTLKIKPRAVTITVDDKSKMVGENDPEFTGTVDGLVNENDLGTITYVRTNSDETVGDYPDVLSAQYTENSNYNVTVVTGDFTITEKQPTTKYADVEVRYYKDSVEENNRLNETPFVMKNQVVGDQIDLGFPLINAYQPDGYKPGVQVGSTYTVIEGENVIKVLYTKLGTIQLGDFIFKNFESRYGASTEETFYAYATVTPYFVYAPEQPAEPEQTEQSEQVEQSEQSVTPSETPAPEQQPATPSETPAPEQSAPSSETLEPSKSAADDSKLVTKVSDSLTLDDGLVEYEGSVTLKAGYSKQFTFAEVSLPAGTYRVEVYEGNGKDDDIVYDDTTYSFTLAVNEDGTYSASGFAFCAEDSKEWIPMENATKVEFTNVYTYRRPHHPRPKPTVEIEDDDALGLNTTDHFAYIVGYGNGEVRPQNNITRAEVATIFFRLLTDDVRDENLTKTNRYSDVAATSWYNTAVSTLSSMGIITGYPDGTFRPNAAITRAEFAAIAARFDHDGDKTTAKFSDIATHWAKDEISIAYNNGWINGYPDGTFGPQRDITRAETMTLVNRVLNRQPETENDLLPNMVTWTDNANPNAWYYLAVQEATNSHYYKFKTNSKYEKWTELRETRDWTQLEK